MVSRGAFGGGVAVTVLVLGLLVAFGVGRFPVAPSDLILALWSRLTGTPSGLPASVEAVVFSIRGTRVIAAPDLKIISRRHVRSPN